MADPTAPVVVIGMHRSGTGLVARMLDTLGVFMGADLEGNHESRWFIGRNESVLRLAGARWDDPGPSGKLLADPELRRRATAVLRRALRSPARTRYTGLRRRPAAWGWKDPRTTLTAPLWLDLFPRARVVHVVRHGVDVAASLVARADTEPFGRGAGSNTMEAALALWEDYVARGCAVAASRGERAAEVRYEELLAQPGPVLGELATFAGLTPGAGELANAAALADPTGRFRHRRRRELAAFAAAARSRLEVHGYG